MAVSDLRAASEDVLSCAKPLVDEARASVACGDVLTGEELFKFLGAEIGKRRSK
ncbi:MULTISPECIES: hypothetical protein [Rhodomicrobium]|uniref:hypothetical protein n=1 Tax=Rhodomicrobium TaxID=1068 RepID=UPI0014825532|nr:MULTISPECIES: hypothetical protein [Rhodomicrobium]